MDLLSPISFEFTAAGIARRARRALTPLHPPQQAGRASSLRERQDKFALRPSQASHLQPPSWDGHGRAPATAEVSIPITDRAFWENRYVLTELRLYKGEGEDNVLVINDAVVSLSREKRIVRTPLTGLDGTVKEYICNGDYDITVAVGIVAVNAAGQIVDEYPAKGIGRVKEFLDINKSVGVYSEFFNIFGISRMVVTRFSLKQDTASSRQTIEIRALSDEDYEIKSTEY